MKLGYVLYRKMGDNEMYVVNPSVFAFAESMHVDEALLFETAQLAYERATKCGLLDWKVGLR